MTDKQMAAAFNEWMRRYIEEPEKFASDWEAIRTFLAEEQEGQEPTYGEQCAAYMELLSAEVRARNGHKPLQP